MSRDVDFLTFFIIWARLQGWTVPLLHVRICVWLDTCTDPVRVLQVFRGAAKSTIYAVYKAYRLYRKRRLVSLIWAADGQLAKKLTRDTINVLRRHPLCVGMLPTKPGAQMFWVNGAIDPRNASMTAVGVNQNVTSARADDIDYDDIEVPKNIKTPEAREALRAKIQEATFILVPGGQETFIGTPHTTDSIYPEQIAAGAASLKIPLFAHAVRFDRETKKQTRYPIPFKADADGYYVITGIHKFARMLKEGVDYHFEGDVLVMAEPPGTVLDVYAGCAWPERFTRDDIEKRRRKTRTLNYWDSQYQLEAKPLTEIRLDPARITAYNVQPEIREANGAVTMMLGRARLVGAAARWDPSSGKLRSDQSAVAVMLQDETGRRYLHHVSAARGEIAEYADDGKTITGGQVWELCDVIERFRLPRMSVETNGIGKFAPAVLRAAIRQRGLVCGVAEIDNTVNKNKRILESIEPLLLSRGMLWGHVDVLRGPFAAQMRDWNPAVADQADDMVDVVAGAVTETPERFRAAIGGNSPAQAPEDWRPTAGVHEVVFER